MHAPATTKVTAEHLRRGAYLYVRQSTLRQVLTNTESTHRQYDLRGRAIALGWAADQVVVIDTDQGQSGASATDRTASNASSPRCPWAGPGSCSAWRSPGWPATTLTGTGCWVRHEALCVRVGMEGLHRWVVAAAW